ASYRRPPMPPGWATASRWSISPRRSNPSCSIRFRACGRWPGAAEGFLPTMCMPPWRGTPSRIRRWRSSATGVSPGRRAWWRSICLKRRAANSPSSKVFWEGFPFPLLAVLEGFLGGLSISPSGSKVAYFRDHGLLEIRDISAPNSVARVRIGYGSYQWEPDERRILVKRGLDRRSGDLAWVSLPRTVPVADKSASNPVPVAEVEPQPVL